MRCLCNPVLSLRNRASYRREMCWKLFQFLKTFQSFSLWCLFMDREKNRRRSVYSELHSNGSLRADAELLPWINVCYVTDVRKSSQNSVYSLSLTFQHWSPAAKSSSGYLALSCRFCDIHTPSEPHDDYRLFPLNVFPVMKGTSSRRSL